MREAPGEPLVDPGACDRRAIEAELVALLYRQTPHAMAFSLMAAAVVAHALWPTAPRAPLLGWCALVLLAFVARLWLFAAHARIRPEGAEVLRWKRPYLGTLAFAAAVWGFGLTWLVANEPPVLEAMAYVYIVGMAGSALTTYSALRSAALTAFFLTLTPMTLWLFASGELVAMSMAAGGLLFAIGGARATQILSASLRNDIQLRRELERATRIAEEAARTDPLTGLYNRRAHTELGAFAVDHCRRLGVPVGLLLLDLDRFKAINDTLGHAAGDAALQAFGALLRQSLRGSDVCGRVGGEEFAVVLPHTTLAEARIVAEKLRLACAGLAIDAPEGRFGFTVSIGLAHGPYGFDALLRQADAAMYEAKLAGRNRVEVSPMAGAAAPGLAHGAPPPTA
jgi:diguanylate cyclase (GGDEF)-like protein